MADNRSLAYLQPTEVQDARAIWVNPAGLGVRPEASVYIDFTAARAGGGRLRQLDAGFNSRGFSFAYQRDIFDGGVTGHTYRLGLGTSAGALAVGFATSLYRGGGAKAMGWDLGGLYRLDPRLTVGATVTNLGQPVVRGLRQAVRYTAGATAAPIPALRASALASAGSGGLGGFALTLRALFGASLPLSALARMDTDQRLRRTQFAFGFTVGGADQAGLVGTTPGDVSSLDNLTLVGVSTRAAVARRH
ncbi:MAG TPA: hypothetical protein VI160_05570 [Gemmatimonadales bacterium]